MDLERAHLIARERGANRVVCWIARVLLWPFVRIYFRHERIGAEHIPKDGPVLLASNHRSFSDPFLIGICTRRPLRFVAKMELFDKRWKARLLLALGAFPVRRGESDETAMETARIVLERGGVVGIFPEGTRVRPGPLAEPKSGVGRLALETGASVVPVAITGTEDIRRGWRIRPRKVRVRFGPSMTFPRPLAGRVTPVLAQGVTARIWPCVQLQWEWLGGVAPIRTAAVIGAGSFGTSIAATLARAGCSVQLGCRTTGQVEALRGDGANERYLPGAALPAAVAPMRVEDLELEEVDLVCLATPSRALADALRAIRGRLAAGAGVLLLTKGLVPPEAELPSETARELVGEQPLACLAGPAHAAEMAQGEAGLVVVTADATFGARLRRMFDRTGLDSELSTDLVGVQLAACAKNAAALAAGSAVSGGFNRAGVAAARVFAECQTLAADRGADPETFSGLAGAGDLVATVLAPASRNRRAGELLAEGMRAEAIERALGQAAEGIDLVPLLALAMRRAGIDAPATTELAGRIARGLLTAPADAPSAEELPARTATGRVAAAQAV